MAATGCKVRSTCCQLGAGIDFTAELLTLSASSCLQGLTETVKRYARPTKDEFTEGMSLLEVVKKVLPPNVTWPLVMHFQPLPADRTLLTLSKEHNSLYSQKARNTSGALLFHKFQRHGPSISCGLPLIFLALRGALHPAGQAHDTHRASRSRKAVHRRGPPGGGAGS